MSPSCRTHRAALALAVAGAIGACAERAPDELSPRDGGVASRSDAGPEKAPMIDAGIARFDPEVIARRLAEAECARLERCEPAELDAWYLGDRAACVRAKAAAARAPTVYELDDVWPAPSLLAGVDLIAGAVSAGSMVFDPARFESCVAIAATIPCDEEWSCEPFVSATRAEGRACLFEEECSAGLWCQKGSVMGCGVCTRRFEPGQPCTAATSCAGGSWCWRPAAGVYAPPLPPDHRALICLPLLSAGEQCRDASGAYLGYCSETETCRGLRGELRTCGPPLKEGEVCWSDAFYDILECEDGLTCWPRFGRCVPLVRARGGESCAESDPAWVECAGVYGCASDTKICEAPVYLPAGAPCSRPAENEFCAPGTRCDEATGTCRPFPAEGEPCSFARSGCAEGLSCLQHVCTRIVYDACE